MPLSLIVQQPAFALAWITAILVALSLHEYAHAFVGTRLGDTTARDAGRLTLNPLAHVDVLGLLMLLLVGFGWGKPVPFDPLQLTNRRWGPVAVALAGPVMNGIALLVSVTLLRIGDHLAWLPPNNLLVIFLVFSLQIHLVLLLFNLIPIPPLDGSKLLLAALDHSRFTYVRFLLDTRGPLILLGLVVLDSVMGGAILGRFFQWALQWVTGWF